MVLERGQFHPDDVTPFTNLSILDLTTYELAGMRTSVSQKPNGSESISTTSSLLLKQSLEAEERDTDLVIESKAGKDKSKKKKKKKF